MPPDRRTFTVSPSRLRVCSLALVCFLFVSAPSRHRVVEESSSAHCRRVEHCLHLLGTFTIWSISVPSTHHVENISSIYIENSTVDTGDTNVIHQLQEQQGQQEQQKQANQERVILPSCCFTFNPRFVEHEGFSQFCRAMQPLFVMPSRFTVARYCYEFYKQEKLNFMKYLKKLSSRIYLTTDAWTFIQNLSYMCITCHFIDDNWTLHKKFINFCQISGHSVFYETTLKLSGSLYVTDNEYMKHIYGLELMISSWCEMLDPRFKLEFVNIIIDKSYDAQNAKMLKENLRKVLSSMYDSYDASIVSSTVVQASEQTQESSCDTTGYAIIQIDD
ncbi:zinc finger BED domain-containing protein RICESLEEPER 1-like [Canna indica]|uniref:Zinc finger BED domain-containing protein RICESLEEPER 1-like n=1 Tax=Canna indica TaxID=4628 RepID=A0AAQ3KS15_9LILI|nr:zinc finger BED domain-containing protein RICESLEEPER 1-like [Canna indica]